MEIFTGIFALVMSLGCFWMSAKFLRIYFKVRGWQRVNARVISKSISVHEKFHTTRSPYKLNAVYRYIIDGVEHEGNKIYLAELLGGQANHRKADADRRLDKIVGIMPVYVDPKDPKRSVMYCEGLGLYLVVFFMGFIALLLGISKFV
jgi:hypothetical protein